MGFPHVVQLARLDRIRQLSPGKQKVQTVWLITCLAPQQADLASLLQLARPDWAIENGTHYRLDLSGGQDRCRVRHPLASTVLGILRRAVKGEYRAWARRQHKAHDSTCPALQERISRRINLVIRYFTGETSRLQSSPAFCEGSLRFTWTIRIEFAVISPTPLAQSLESRNKDLQ
jgi:hypothetical protein